jgi:hypothetical protein
MKVATETAMRRKAGAAMPKTTMAWRCGERFIRLWSSEMLMARSSFADRLWVMFSSNAVRKCRATLAGNSRVGGIVPCFCCRVTSRSRVWEFTAR